MSRSQFRSKIVRQTLQWRVHRLKRVPRSRDLWCGKTPACNLWTRTIGFNRPIAYFKDGESNREKVFACRLYADVGEYKRWLGSRNKRQEIHGILRNIKYRWSVRARLSLSLQELHWRECINISRQYTNMLEKWKRSNCRNCDVECDYLFWQCITNYLKNF